MTVHTTSTPTVSDAPTGRFGRKFLVAGVATVAIVTALAGAGLWARGSDESPAPAVPAVTAPAPAEMTGEATTRVFTPTTYYVVASEDEATAVRTGINDANRIRAMVGEAPVLDSVIVMSSDADARAFIDMLAGANTVLTDTGLPEVVDLRAR